MMLRRVLLLPLVIWALAVYAQDRGWCGYALISGLPLLEGQLTVLEALTPAKSASVNPYQLFQYRFNLAHTEVMIEGCFGAFLTKELLSSLLLQVIPFDAKGMESQLATIDPSKGTVTERQIVALYIDQKLTYTLFEGNRGESAARARAYIASRLSEWEPPCDAAC